MTFFPNRDYDDHGEHIFDYMLENEIVYNKKVMASLPSTGYQP